MKTTLGRLIKNAGRQAVPVQEDRSGDEMWDVLCACGHTDKVPRKMFSDKKLFKEGKPVFFCRACSRRIKES